MAPDRPCPRLPPLPAIIPGLTRNLKGGGVYMSRMYTRFVRRSLVFVQVFGILPEKGLFSEDMHKETHSEVHFLVQAGYVH